MIMTSDFYKAMVVSLSQRQNLIGKEKEKEEYASFYNMLFRNSPMPSENR